MKVLVIGQGGREHALAWKLAQSPHVKDIYVAPGNYGTGLLATNVGLPVTAVSELATWAEGQAIDLTVVGPEAALAAGIVDAFGARGLRIFGPTRAAARLETSKAWAKRFMLRHDIPTAAARVYGDREEAERYLRGLPSNAYPQVIKADGLAAGKGVHIAQHPTEAVEAARAIFSGDDRAGRVVIEMFLEGFEVSFLAISDGTTARPLACAHDYKRAYDGDQGPMTGGMGAYSPLGMEDRLTDTVMARIVEPAIRGMAAEGTPYEGILYAGLMLTGAGPYVLEFNARFGDPEAQVLVPRWEDDLYAVLEAATDRKLARLGPLRWSEGAACGVVVAAAGYPDAVESGHPILGLDQLDAGALVFHGGTRAESAPARGPMVEGRPHLAAQAVSEGDGADAAPVTSGGRVLTVVGRGAALADARAAAYATARRIQFSGCWYRHDIGGMPAPLHDGPCT